MKMKMKTITARRSSLLSLSCDPVAKIGMPMAVVFEWPSGWGHIFIARAIHEYTHEYCSLICPCVQIHNKLDVVIEALVIIIIIIIINIVKPLRLLLRLPRVTLYGLPPFTCQRRWAWHPGESDSGRLLLLPLLLRFQLFFTHC